MAVAVVAAAAVAVWATAVVVPAAEAVAVRAAAAVAVRARAVAVPAPGVAEGEAMPVGVTCGVPPGPQMDEALDRTVVAARDWGRMVSR